MSQIITFPLPTGPNYVIPDVGDENWGQNVTNFLVAIPSGVLPSAGTFSLTGDVSFGPTFGLVSQYFKTPTINPASAGFIRLSKTDTIDWRNNANSANLALGINGSDQLTFNGNIFTTQNSSPTFSSLTLSSPLTVPNGGTGDVSFIANSVVCGGTTSSNPLQSVASVGLSGQFLQSQGAGLLPTWVNAAGTGTVNSGLQFQLAYYATSTNAVSGLTLITPSRALVSDANGLPVASSVTTTELNFVSGVTSSIQTQLNGKQASGSYAHTNLDNIASVSTDLPMNNHKITGLANGTAATDAAAFGQIPTVPTLVAMTVQRFTSGSGTYTRPTSPTPLYLKVTVVGGGAGGGGGGGGSPGNSSAATASTFGSTLSAGGGSGTSSAGITSTSAGGAGGTNSTSFGTVLLSIAGGHGMAGSDDSQITAAPGGLGGATPIGGGARGGTPTFSAGSSSAVGGAGIANTGEGGQGASSGNAFSSMATGGGGGAGGYLYVLVTSPSSTYSYAVGAGSAGGAAGSINGAAGGAGASGIVIVEEYYQ